MGTLATASSNPGPPSQPDLLQENKESHPMAYDPGDAADIALTVEQVATLFRKDPSTIRKWRRRGKLKPRDDGRIPAREVERHGITIPEALRHTLVQQQRQAVLEGMGAGAGAEVVLLRQEVAFVRRERDLLQQELALAREREKLMWRLLEGTHLPVSRPAEQLTTPPSLAAAPALEPRADSQLGRILAYLRTEGRPKLAWQVEQALGLAERPHRDLSKLVERGLVLRPKPGTYLARPSSTTTPSGQPQDTQPS